MSRKVKTPKPYVPPKLWRWYRLAGYGNILLPFRPNHLEFFWVRKTPCDLPLTEQTWLYIRGFIQENPGRITKTRNRQDSEPAYQWEGIKIMKINAYAAIRDKQPLHPPPVMDFSHFV
jgi:hypothetical protein